MAAGSSGRLVRLGCCVACVLAIACKGERRPTPQALVKGRDAAPVVIVDSPTARGPLVEEAEPNNAQAEASPLTLGAGAKGSLDGETDVDWYRVQVDRDGTLDARVSGISGVDLMLEVFDGEGKSLAKSDRGPATVVEGAPNLPVKAGTYFVTIGEFVKKRPAKKKKKGKAAEEPEGRVGQSPAYELEVSLRSETETDFEREPNDDLEGAREVLLGDRFNGFVGWNGDRDLWKLSLEGFTTDYTLDVDVEGVPDIAFTLEILDGDGKVVVKSKANKGAPIATRNIVPVTGEGASKYYYARISADRSNPIDAYVLRVSTRLVEPDEEMEPNDEASQASALRPDGTQAEGRVRGFATAGDVDIYALSASASAQALDVWVTPSADFDAEIEVYVGDALVASGNAGKLGTREELLAVPVAANAQVTVRVRGELADVAAGEYELKWALREGAPAVDDVPSFYDE